jgi:hypothetical protein
VQVAELGKSFAEAFGKAEAKVVMNYRSVIIMLEDVESIYQIN